MVAVRGNVSNNQVLLQDKGKQYHILKRKRNGPIIKDTPVIGLFLTDGLQTQESLTVYFFTVSLFAIFSRSCYGTLISDCLGSLNCFAQMDFIHKTVLQYFFMQLL